jgi:hypothetical protein
MKKLLLYILIFSLTFTVGESMLFSKSKSTVKFFAPGGLYIYVMGSYNRFAPPDDYYDAMGSESSHAYAPLLGIGYRVVNINDRVFISLEGEYSPMTYDFGDFARNQQISVLSLILNFEGRIFSKFPLVLFGGFGVGSHGLSDLGYENDQGDYIFVGDDTVTILVLDVGIKVPITRFLLFRSEFQWNSEAFGPYEYYTISQVDPWDKKLDFLHSSAFSVGLDIHL